MSCMSIAPRGGCLPDGCVPTVPVEWAELEQLQRDGLRLIELALNSPLNRLPVPATQFVGSSLRPDCCPFYLSTAAPRDPFPGSGPNWRGGFFAPFGYGHVVGTLDFDIPSEQSPVATIVVAAQFVVLDQVHVAANWRVSGPAPNTTPLNAIAVIDAINVVSAGPHREEDIRRCIALHAPQRVWGEPRVMVAAQCGVAVACLIEAVC
jgi:hypothetical protein